MRLLFFLSFLLLLSANATAQCYQTFLDEGKNFVRQSKWDKAIEAFENGKRCQADKPANGDATLNTLIGEARQKKQAATERKKQQAAEAQQREQEAARQREQDRQRREAANREDDGAWDIAQSAQNAAACQRYLDKYPTGRHTTQAKQCVKDYSDSDGDGVLNKNDRCPDTPGPASNAGCKEEKKPEPTLPTNMVLVPGGTFSMGSTEGDSNEKPVHSVTLSSFYLSKYEVTMAEFKKFVDDTGYQTDAEKEGWSHVWSGSAWEKKKDVNWRHDTKGNIRPVADYNHPVIHVSWNDATAYCQWLSKKTGRAYRLPTEAEWEYAAGGGDPNAATRTTWAGTAAESELRRYANYSRTGSSDTYPYTAPVGSLLPNRVGLYDLSGNVWEWCSDLHSTYPSAAQTNPTGATGGAYRVLRGGCWNTTAPLCRAANRNKYGPTNSYNSVGFRVASPFQ